MAIRRVADQPWEQLAAPTVRRLAAVRAPSDRKALAGNTLRLVALHDGRSSFRGVQVGGPGFDNAQGFFADGVDPRVFP